MHCGSDSWGGRCLSLAAYVIGTGTPRGGSRCRRGLVWAILSSIPTPDIRYGCRGCDPPRGRTIDLHGCVGLPTKSVSDMVLARCC